MWLKTAIASAFLMLGAGIAAAQTPNAAPPPRDLTFETRDLIFEVLDLELRIESMGAQPPTKLPAPAPPASTLPPKLPAPDSSAAPPPAAVAALGRRVALVIGNAGYKVGPLRNPGNDAAAVAEAFEKKLLFDKVILRQDLGLDGFRTVLHQFARDATGADTAVVYFAGHGMEMNGRNFLIPVDA